MRIDAAYREVLKGKKSSFKSYSESINSRFIVKTQAVVSPFVNSSLVGCLAVS